MKNYRSKILLFSVLILMVFGWVGNVYSLPAPAVVQQAVTPSATWDIRTPPYTPTSGNTSYFPTSQVTATSVFTCPAGTPVGWGTVTPNALWNFTCSACSPATATPTVWAWPTSGICNYTTPIGNITPGAFYCLPTATATFTSTPVVTPTSFVVPFDLVCAAQSGTSCNKIMPGVLKITTDVYMPTAGLVQGYWDTVPSYTLVDPHVVYIYGHYNYVKTGADTYASSVEWNSGYAGYSQWTDYMLPSGSDYRFSTMSANTLLDHWWVGVQLYSAGAVQVGWAGTYWIVSSYPSPDLSTPTPTPAPSTGYCSTVQSDSSLAGGSITFWGPSGGMTCFYTPSFDLGWLFKFIQVFGSILPPEVNSFINAWASSGIVPANTICLQPYDFQTLDILSVQISFVWFINLLIAVFVLRHFMSK